MKSVGFLKALVGAVALVVACSSYAQTNPASGAMAPHSTKMMKKANRQLGRKVRSALSKAQGISTANIAVRARGGAVTLTGSVPDQGQVDKAGEIAKSVDGVTSVTNKLTVVVPH